MAAVRKYKHIIKIGREKETIRWNDKPVALT